MFWNLQNSFDSGWLFLDYFCDLIYVIDIYIRMHEGRSQLKKDNF